jgi:hypothetical protein
VTLLAGPPGQDGRPDDELEQQRRSQNDTMFGDVVDEDRYVADVQGVSDVLF